jgi:hypothetical protein
MTPPHPKTNWWFVAFWAAQVLWAFGSWAYVKQERAKFYDRGLQDSLSRSASENLDRLEALRR